MERMYNAGQKKRNSELRIFCAPPPRRRVLNFEHSPTYSRQFQPEIWSFPVAQQALLVISTRFPRKTWSYFRDLHGNYHSFFAMCVIVYQTDLSQVNIKQPIVSLD